jgi:hypothetical protein
MDKSEASVKKEGEEEAKEGGNPDENGKEIKLSKAELMMLEPDYIEPRMIAKYELIC